MAGISLKAENNNPVAKPKYDSFDDDGTLTKVVEGSMSE